VIKRAILLIGLAGVIGFAAIQLVPYGRDHTNPPVVAEPPWDAPATRAYAVTACFDCHSNQTVWPWYSNVAPISWLVQDDVDRGRHALNFSDWRQFSEGGEAAEKVAEGEMPPFNYLLMHPDARFSEADKAAFIEGLIATFGRGD
jgi:hypothetical protein